MPKPTAGVPAEAAAAPGLATTLERMANTMDASASFNLMEARLSDKQALIDALWGDVRQLQSRGLAGGIGLRRWAVGIVYW